MTFAHQSSVRFEQGAAFMRLIIWINTLDAGPLGLARLDTATQSCV